MTDSYNVSYHTVAFLDVLGQQEAWKDVRSLPSTPAEHDAMLKKIHDNVMFIDMLRTCAASFIPYQAPPPELANRLSGQAREDFLKSGIHPMKFQAFSDCLVLSGSLQPTEAIPFPENALFFTLTSAGITMLSAMAAQHVIRGGVDVQVGIPMPKSGEIYGPALNSAYELESQVADYPRIVIGDNFVACLKSFAEATGSDNHTKFARSIAKRCQTLLAKDPDGRMILDYLGPGFIEISGGASPDNAMRGLVPLAKQHIVKQRAAAHEKADSKRIGRYERLVAYFNSRGPFGETI